MLKTILAGLLALFAFTATAQAAPCCPDQPCCEEVASSCCDD